MFKVYVGCWRITIKVCHFHFYFFIQNQIASYMFVIYYIQRNNRKYHLVGCASWKWFYPFHYAPFASDFVDLDNIDVRFPSNTVPKNPLEQLMCVFPAASGQFLPTTWRNLMSDPVSINFLVISI